MTYEALIWYYLAGSEYGMNATLIQVRFIVPDQKVYMDYTF
jgi:hypothetical protein